MASQGTAVINFGAAPGGYEAVVAITGQVGIGTSNLVEAWVIDTPTADHSADEHRIDPPRVFAGNIVAGVGFTIYGYAEPRIVAIPDLSQNQALPEVDQAPKTYGQWTVGWVWN